MSPVLATLAVSMARDLLIGRIGIDAIALLSMTAALAFGAIDHGQRHAVTARSRL